MLAEGSIVFVRAIQATVFHRPNPTAYEAEFIGSDSQGHNQFRLNTARPRYRQRRYQVN